MPRLPVPGSDNGTWGDILNDFLLAAHNADGSLKSTGALAAKADDSAVVHNSGNGGSSWHQNLYLISRRATADSC